MKKKRALRVGTLAAGDFLLSAIGLPDGGGKIIAVGDEFPPVEAPAAGYDAAVAAARQTADLLARGEFWDRAEFCAGKILDLLEAHGAGRPGRVISLSDFECEEDLRFLKPEQDWTLLYHRLGNAAVSAILADEGVGVVLKKLNLKMYYDWLAENRLENTPENRAAFCAV
jgi:hypothetical protein